jgi:hypothetical protein
MLPIDQLMANDQSSIGSTHQLAMNHHTITGHGCLSPAHLFGDRHQSCGAHLPGGQRPAQGFITPVDIGRVICMAQRIHPPVPELEIEVIQWHGILSAPVLQASDGTRIWMRRKRRDQLFRSTDRTQAIRPLSHVNPGLRRLRDQPIRVQELDLPSREEASSKVAHPGVGLNLHIGAKLTMVAHGHRPDHEARTSLTIASRRPTGSNRCLDRDLLEEPPDLSGPSNLPRSDRMPRKSQLDTKDGIRVVHEHIVEVVG